MDLATVYRQLHIKINANSQGLGAETHRVV